MGRPSKLTEKQWAGIERRLVNDEECRPLAREYGITEAAIRKRFGALIKKQKELAKQLVKTEEEIRTLPISAQINVANLAAKLRSISEHLCGAAEFGAMTAHRLSGLANSEVQKIDDVDPLKSLDAVRGVAVLTKLANDSAEIGLNLLKANKETVDEMNRADDKPEPKQIVFTVADASA